MHAPQQVRPLPLVRLLIIGMAAPAACAALDQALLSQLDSGTQNSSLTVLTLTAFVVQVGLFGWLCGRWIESPLLRWLIYGWCWVLVDLQTLTAGALAGQSYYWGNVNRLLPGSLFVAQLGLVTIWAVLGRARWYLRWPAALVLGACSALPILGQHYHGNDLTAFLFIQTCALAFICGVLRWQRFRLTAPSETAGAMAQGDLRPMQFGVRHVLIWTTSLAVVLALARALNLLSPGLFATLLGPRWLDNVTAGGLIAIVLVVALWAALGKGYGVRYLALVTATPLAGVLVAASEWYHIQTTSPNTRWLWAATPPPLWSWTFWRGWWDSEWWLFAWTCLAGGLLFAALLFCRTLGYRLTRA